MNTRMSKDERRRAHTCAPLLGEPACTEFRRVLDECDRLDDCEAEERNTDACGECRVCLATLLDERTRDLEATQVDRLALRHLVEMDGSLSWNERMCTWVCGTTYHDGVGDVVASTWANDEDHRVAIADAYAQWLNAGRPKKLALTDLARARIDREIDESSLRQAERVRARRAEEAGGG
jgi:hypothetical protein